MNWSSNHVLLAILVIVLAYLIFVPGAQSEHMHSLHNVEEHRIGHEQNEVYNPRNFRPGGARYGELDTLEPNLNNGHCSKSCCVLDHWPLSFPLEDDVDRGKYTSSSYSCNNPVSGSGCLCLPKHSSDWFARRGGNSACGSLG